MLFGVFPPVPGFAMSWVDLIVLALAIIAGVSGWRHGMAVALLSFVGVLGGAIIGVRLAPGLAAGGGNPGPPVGLSGAGGGLPGAPRGGPRGFFRRGPPAPPPGEPRPPGDPPPPPVPP